MKIKLPFHYHLKINKQFSSIKSLLPIGCDCHPAYMLSKLELRNESLPFDWLDTKPLHALPYAFQNIKDHFSDFLIALKKNENGKVYASKFPEALFYHFDDLIDNEALQHKILERIQRFLKIYHTQPCYFIHTLTSHSLNSNSDLEFVRQSILEFQSLLKKEDELLIYLRFDESLNENCDNAQLLQELVHNLSQVRMIKYIRYKEKYGIWGNETEYKKFIQTLGIKTRFSGLKIKIEKQSLRK